MRLSNSYTDHRSRRGGGAAPFVALLLSAGLALVGCTSPAAEPDNESVVDSSEPNVDAAPATIPDTRVGEATQWAIDMLNSTEDPTVAEIEARFSEEFLTALPVEDFLAQTNTAIRPAGPFELSAYEESDELSAVATLEGGVGGAVRLQLGLSEQGEITIMLVSPVP